MDFGQSAGEDQTVTLKADVTITTSEDPVIFGNDTDDSLTGEFALVVDPNEAGSNTGTVSFGDIGSAALPFGSLFVVDSDSVDFTGAAFVQGDVNVVAETDNADDIDVQEAIDSVSGSITFTGKTELNANLDAGQSITIDDALFLAQATGVVTLTADQGDIALLGTTTATTANLAVSAANNVTLSQIGGAGAGAGFGEASGTALDVDAGGTATLLGGIYTDPGAAVTDGAIDFTGAPSVVLGPISTSTPPTGWSMRRARAPISTLTAPET